MASPGNQHCGLCHSDIFISQLIDRADRLMFKQIQLSHHCPNSLLPSSRLPYSRYSLRSRGHRFSQFCIRICSLIDVCFSIFCSIILPHCICFFLLIVFFFMLCVLKVWMSPLFSKGYMTCLLFIYLNVSGKGQKPLICR